MNPLVYASPIYGDGVVVGMGGFFGTTIAVPAGGSGDVTAQRLWQSVRTKNRLGSGLIYDGHIYILNTDGMAECMELKTGKTVWMERLRPRGAKGESWSSMVRSGDRLYILNQSGDCLVLKAAPKFELLATNHLGTELTNSSLAVSDGRLYIRTHSHLWCIK
jgi:outer membrane protein assembly factor BamB